MELLSVALEGEQAENDKTAHDQQQPREKCLLGLLPRFGWSQRHTFRLTIPSVVLHIQIAISRCTGRKSEL